ncbi:MAG: hypothetical protein DCF25_18490 [Leptolyngbya foveolarum]|uniref:SNIPE associated domain-containing protein n=1 Tax=Leptolyngbya foveolarum TaxID=47253 RepID=A0A2W4U3S8_9CYAN|nr:MAG: hypothetical protein DCF25_18490 [Leptolyngbya foveolarum]
MVKQEKACFSKKRWAVGDDPRKGNRMIKNYLKVIQNAFETACRSSINKAKTGNINKIKQGVVNDFERLNNLSKELECQISNEYLTLKLRLLDVKYEMELKKQEEKERSRMLNDKIRKEKKERDNLEKEKQKEEEAANQEKEYREELEKIKIEMGKAIGSKMKELQEKTKV